MARYTCTRCFVTCNTTENHLCADVARRLKRREAQVQAVLGVFRARGLLDGFERTQRDIAESVVKALAGMGVQDD